MKKLTTLIIAFSLALMLPTIASAAEGEDGGDRVPYTGPELGIDDVREWIEEQQEQNDNYDFDDTNINDGQINYPNSVTGERFTGMGTVVDYVVTGYRHFYTIVTREETVFYMIIDFDKNGDNVYFLSPVDRNTLLWEDYQDKIITEDEFFAIQDSLMQYQANDMQQSGQNPEYEQTYRPYSQPAANDNTGKEDSGGYDFSRLIIMAAAFVIVGGFGYYKVIYKKKAGGKQGNIPDEADADDDDYDDDEDEDDENEDDDE